MLDMPADKLMEAGIGFVENANPDAVSTASLVFTPEVETLFRMDVPFIEAVIIGQG